MPIPMPASAASNVTPMPASAASSTTDANTRDANTDATADAHSDDEQLFDRIQREEKEQTEEIKMQQEKWGPQWLEKRKQHLGLWTEQDEEAKRVEEAKREEAELERIFPWWGPMNEAVKEDEEKEEAEKLKKEKEKAEKEEAEKEKVENEARGDREAQVEKNIREWLKKDCVYNSMLRAYMRQEDQKEASKEKEEALARSSGAGSSSSSSSGSGTTMQGLVPSGTTKQGLVQSGTTKQARTQKEDTGSNKRMSQKSSQGVLKRPAASAANFAAPKKQKV